MSEAKELLEVKQRLALVETRLEQLFEAMNIAPRQAPSPKGSDGWWGGGDGDEAASGAEGDAELQELIGAGKTIQAVKHYRELTGVGLAEAKKAVESLGA